MVAPGAAGGFACATAVFCWAVSFSRSASDSAGSFSFAVAASASRFRAARVAASFGSFVTWIAEALFRCSSWP